jgi:hypothetical protein
VTDSIQNAYRRAVTRQGIVRDFAWRWADAHTDTLRREWADRPEAFAAEFSLPSTVYPAFVRYAAEQGVRPAPGGRWADVAMPAPDGSETVPPMTPALVEAARPDLETQIKAYLGQRLFGPSMRIRLRNRIDPVVQSAQASWGRAQRWAARYPVPSE